MNKVQKHNSFYINVYTELDFSIISKIYLYFVPMTHSIKFEIKAIF